MARTAALHALLSGLLAAGPAMAAKNITPTGNMTFGRFAAGSGGSISVSSAGARARTGGVVLLSSPSASAASFAIAGTSDNRVYILSMPPDGSVTMTSGGNRMAVNQFVSSVAAGPLPSGNQTVTVGATLQVAPNQRPGNYSGTFHVTLEFQ